MKKLALSLILIATSGAYIWANAGQSTGLDAGLLDSTALTSVAQPSPPPAPIPVVISAPPPQPKVPAVVKPATVIALAQPQIPFPSPRPKPIAAPPAASPPATAPQAAITQASMSVVPGALYADGTYSGSPVDAYYGLVQIQAVVQSGQLAGIKVLQYPSDRRTSVAINRQALPMLRDEALSAQSARVDIISGATLTSQAFIRSLGSALKKAHL